MMGPMRIKYLVLLNEYHINRNLKWQSYFPILQIQTLKQGMKDAAALQSQTQMLERSLQEARTEIQTLRKDLGNTKTLRTTIQEQQRSLESFRTALASQEQLQRNQSKCREGAGEGRVSCPFGLLLISTCIPGEGVWVLERC